MIRRNRQAFPENRQGYDPGEAGDFPGMDVVSAGEYTGMIPAPPEDEFEAESYAQLSPLPEPQPARHKKGR